MKLNARRWRTRQINLKILSMSEEINIDTYGRKAPDAADIRKGARSTKDIQQAIDARGIVPT